MSITEKVIILKTTKYGEADLILHGLNKKGGKLHFIAKSALKSKKRFGGGVLEPLNYAEISYIFNKKFDGLHILEEARLINDFPLLRKSYDRLELALYFLSIIDRISMNEDIHSADNFNLLGNALRKAETTENLNLLRCAFEIKVLQFQGVLDGIDEFKDILSKSISDCDHIQVDGGTLLYLQKVAHQNLEEWLGTIKTDLWIDRDKTP